MRTHTIIALAALASAASGCSKPQPTTPGSPTCAFSVSAPTTAFGSSGGSGTANVTTGSACTWSASSQVDWLRVGGDTHTGSGSVAFSVLASDGTASRTASLTVASQAIAISQAGGDPPPPGCTVSLSAEPDDYERDGGNGQLRVSAAAGCAWALKQDAPWLTIEGATQGTGPATIKVSAAANDDAAARRLTISAGATSVVVTQPGQGDCLFQVSPVFSTVSADPRAGNVSVNTSRGCRWSASILDATWLHINRAGGVGPDAIAFQTDTNPVGQSYRTGKIAIRWLAPTAGQNVLVTQAGDCTIVFNGRNGATDPLSVGAGGGDFHYFILSDPVFTCPWTVENNDSWITVIFPAERVGSGDGELHFTVAPNPSAAPRQTSIVIGRRALSITQAGR